MNLATTVAGNLTADPSLRFTNNGRAVANFTIAHTPRVNVGGEWKDGDTIFLNCVAWGQIAENVAESFGLGTRMLATGTLVPNNWTDNDGNKRTQLQLLVDDVGASVKYKTAGIRKPKQPTITELVRGAKTADEVVQRMKDAGIDIADAEDVLPQESQNDQ